MSPGLRRNGVALALLLALSLGAALRADARIAHEEYVRQLKLLEQRMLMQEPAQRLAELRERARETKRTTRRAKKPRAGLRARKPPVEGAGEWGSRVTVHPLGTSGLSKVAGIPNVRVNDPTGEPVGSCQSEVSLAALGNYVVATWNDGQGIHTDPPSDTQGYGYSIDGGVTWKDGGVPRNSPQMGEWASDPVVVVNPKTGDFYYSALCDPSANTNGIAVVKGRFVADTLQWGTPTLVFLFNNSSAVIDKEWLAVDSLSGNLYMTYTNFIVSGGNIVNDRIEFVRSTDDNQTWNTALYGGTPLVLSSPQDGGYVQGSRPVVGPNGEVYTGWWAIGQLGPSDPRDFMRVRKSIDSGASFLPEVTADGLFSNWGSGAPGFNRGTGIAFPSLSVDRSNGPHRGRLYLAWNESLNFYDDDLGSLTSRSEIEPNDSPAQATSFTVGQLLRGTVATPGPHPGDPGDWDYFRFNGVQGQTVVFFLDSLDVNLDPAFRIFCTNGTTRLAFCQTGVGTQELLVFTPPTTAVYYLRVASYTGNSIGRYTIQTGIANHGAERGRDQRDIFVKTSDDGVTWNPTVRVNSDPPYFDDWLPEVAVSGTGRAFLGYFDWHDSPIDCGGSSNVYLVRSDDGGATWGNAAPVSTVATDWTATYSTLIPNHGDYIGLFASDTLAYVAWGDGRDFDPNVYAAVTSLNCAAAQVTASAQAAPDSVTLTWNISNQPGIHVAVERRFATGSVFAVIDSAVADGNGTVVYGDPNVVGGISYVYRLSFSGLCQDHGGDISVSVPGTSGPKLELLGIHPNPTPGSMIVSFVLIDAQPATLELLDISGRRLHSRQVDSPAAGTYTNFDLTQGFQPRAGIYIVRLTQGGETVLKKVSVLPGLVPSGP